MLSYNDHFKLYYDDDGTWHCEQGVCSSMPLGQREANLHAAQLISDLYPKPLKVMLSGGSDSEVAALSLCDAGVEFEASIIKMNKFENIHDISYAITFCESRGIKYELVDFDVEHFLENELLYYADTVESPIVELVATCWLVDKIDGTPIFGGGDSHIKKGTDGWYVSELERVSKVMYNYLTKTGRDGVCRFHQFMPEQIVAYLENPVMVDLVHDRIPGKLGSNSSKLRAYQVAYPEMLYRPKYTGWDKIVDVIKPYREFLDRRGYSDQEQLVEYNLTLNRLKYGKQILL